MDKNYDLQDLTIPLSKPYAVTHSRLGSTTKLIDEKFICSPNQVELLFDAMGEKLKSFQPTKAGFQYLISFTDSTHYENNDLSTLRDQISSSNKSTERLILNWVIGHEYDGIENELSVTVRISNPMNPFVLIQAMMSKDHSDADRLDFEDGAVSVSINGATQNIAEEISAIVKRWASACPQPQSTIGINNFIDHHLGKILFLNSWISPILYILCSFVILTNISIEETPAYSFVAFSGFIIFRTMIDSFNLKIEKWCRYSRKFSLFLITGGDSNQQNKIAAKSKTNAIKLVISLVLSFSLNVTAGYFTAYYPMDNKNNQFKTEVKN